MKAKLRCGLPVLLAFIHCGVGCDNGHMKQSRLGDRALLEKYKEYLVYDRDGVASEILTIYTYDAEAMYNPPMRIIGVYGLDGQGMRAGEKGWMCIELKGSAYPPFVEGRGGRPQVVPLLCEFFGPAGKLAHVDILAPPNATVDGLHWRAIQAPPVPGAYRLKISLDTGVDVMEANYIGDRLGVALRHTFFRALQCASADITVLPRQ